MVIIMLKKLFKVVLPIFLAVLFGGISAKIVFANYDKQITTTINGKKIYLIQSGAYSNYDNMIKNTLVNNYIYYQDDDGLYKSVIGITENQDNIEKIKTTYKGNVIITEYYSTDKNLNTKLQEYDLLLSKTTDTTSIKKIILQMLELYKDKDFTLTKIIS